MFARWLSGGLLAVGLLGWIPLTNAVTVTVAAHDAAEASKARAEFVCDGQGDQDEINAAIRALPAAGGTVQLSEGTFDIRRIEGELGGVLITRSHVTLAGQGAATLLRQADGQETNVIRILGEGVGHITIRDLAIDANRDGNPLGEGDASVAHSRFEYCGIKAFCARPGGGGVPVHNITVRNCIVRDARRLGIMLEGVNMSVLDNHIGNATSDAVEILRGPGRISGNYFEITGPTHVAVGSDYGDSIHMAGNTVHVRAGGRLDVGFRSWAKSQRHVIANNILIVDPDGHCGAAMEIRGYGAVLTGNIVEAQGAERLPLRITGGNTLVTGNHFVNVEVVVDDRTPELKPIVIGSNLLDNTIITHRRGRLVNDTGETMRD